MSRWASPYIEKLKQGESVQFRPKGNSMSPKIKSGDLVEVKPLDDSPLKLNDIVLCKVHNNHYLHAIRQIDPRRGYLIGNNLGRLNGWTRLVYGKLNRL